MSEIKIGCEVFITRENEILLGKRKNCFGAGTWGLPGGHLEPGEKLVDGAKRELGEELGIENPELELVTIVDDNDRDPHYLHISFKLKEENPKIKLMEPEFCEAWEYFDLDNLPEVFSPHIRIIETYRSKKLYLY